ncbi:MULTISPECIES: glycoside hydrolase family 97 protein [Niastella]|uniref:Glycoside hydrolase family 97 catalytic domain-containing protein n=1 Tax=Niastella soli TaxID=2821487 RepID=A0ABS3YPJ5_9BACT|nr:glycoside hydrolase family 97 protein [Niastella soli]MBO9199808.1 glycoside hydrolase family 97 catalytic domain-containing protein [Niastella soli]
MKKLVALCITMLLVCISSFAQSSDVTIFSPDRSIQVTCHLDSEGKPSYSVQYKNSTVLETSQLGLVFRDGDFSKGLTKTMVTPVTVVKDKYKLVTGKRQNNIYTANHQVIQYKNATGSLLDIIWQVSNDGVAFRYHFTGPSTTRPQTINTEITSFHLPATTKAWLQPMSVAKTGWEQVNPCYEEYYEKGIAAGTPSPLKAGWVYPALFQTAGHWLLITEANMDGHYCGTRLDNDSANTNYHIAFPDAREIMPGGGVNPLRVFSSPWRIITIGSLATIIESSLGTDLAQNANPAVDFSFAKAGKSAWSWALLKDDSIVYDVQKRFIDYAADMHWQYSLIDVNWDTRIGYDSMQLLINYAKQKKVGVWLWYNSAGSWNTTPYHPRNKLLTHEDRVKEFRRLKKMGVAGIKIDFFGGDGQSMIQYYIDILNDAAEHHLMVNFHGATLPRGWQRTWPNLMSAEAIKGFEYITFGQSAADEEPAHAAMLPFTRNAFDPMDFTPMCLYKIPRINRQTTAAFELALSVLFLSGAQHFAETPVGMAHMPGYVKEFLQQLPTAWDDVRFIDGFPGEFVVLARKSGNKWYIAGINGSTQEKTVSLDLAAYKAKKAELLLNSKGDRYIDQQAVTLQANKKENITLGAHDGFVMVLEQ